MSATVTDAGQVTLPQDVLDKLKLKPGSQVDFRVEPDGLVVLLKVARAGQVSPIEKLRGIAGPGMSTDEIMAMTRGEGSTLPRRHQCFLDLITDGR